MHLDTALLHQIIEKLLIHDTKFRYVLELRMINELRNLQNKSFLLNETRKRLSKGDIFMMKKCFIPKKCEKSV